MITYHTQYNCKAHIMCHGYIAPISTGAVGSNYLRVILSMMNIEQDGGRKGLEVCRGVESTAL